MEFSAKERVYRVDSPNYPIPQIVLAEREDNPNAFLVLDGKQRLLTLRQFCSDPDQHEEDRPFPTLRLQALTVREDLNGTTYRSLIEDETLVSDRDAFENSTIRTVIIRRWPNEQFLYRVFLRLNTGSVPLSPQELRQALRPGPFVDFADEFAIESSHLRKALRISHPDFRMRDTELVIRHFAFANFVDAYRGDLKKFLDASCDSLNKRWVSGRADEIEAQGQDLNAAIETTFEIFTERHSFRRWRGSAFEGRFNRAVFDLMTFFFRRREVGPEAIANRDAVVRAFTQLCSDDVVFSESISTTTKSRFATAYRLVRWGDVLTGVLGLDVQVPESQRRVLAEQPNE